MWILVHLYHHHHYQQSSFSSPTILTWKSNLAATLGSLFSEGPQIVSTQIHDNCFWIFKDLEFFSLFGLALEHDLLKLLKQQPLRVPLSALQNGVVLCWKLWPFLQRILNSPTTHCALFSPHMEAHWHHWSTRWILSNIKVGGGRRLCQFLDFIIWHNLHHLAHLSPYPTEWVGAWPFQVVYFCPLQWCDSPKSFLLLWKYAGVIVIWMCHILVAFGLNGVRCWEKILGQLALLLAKVLAKFRGSCSIAHSHHLYKSLTEKKVTNNFSNRKTEET